MARKVAVFLLAVVACGRKSGSESEQGGGTVAGTATAPAPAGTLYPAGMMLRGDHASLVYFLQNVDTVENAQVSLTYAPATVVITRNGAIRALQSVSWDGVTWRFDAAEPAVQRLKQGSVLLVWGLAIRRVTQVDRAGDVVTVRTEEAQLTDAVTDASIKWDAPAHLLQGAMAMRVPKPADSVHFRAADFRFVPVSRSPFRLAAFVPRDTAPADSAADPPALYSESFKLKVGSYAVAMAFGAPSEDALNLYAQFAYGEDAEEPVGLPGELDPAFKYGGKFADWVKKQQEARDKEAAEGKKKAKEIRDETKMTSGTGPGLHSPIPKTTEEQQRQKEEEDAEAEYEKKYGKPSRSSTEGKPKLPDMPKVPTSFKDALGSAWKELAARTAIKVTAEGSVTGFRSKGDIEIRGGSLEHASIENPDFHLQGDIMWSARIDEAVFAGHTHVEVPVTYRVPMIVGGLPMFLEIAVNAQIQPALTSKKATAVGQRHIDFRKGASLQITTSSVSGEEGEADASAEKGPEERITGLGVSGLMIALQVPRIGLGFGIIGSNLLAYFDVVVASGATFTGTTGIIQCTHEQLVASFNVGISAQFLGFPLGEQRKTGAAKTFEWDDPAGRKCG